MFRVGPWTLDQLEAHRSIYGPWLDGVFRVNLLQAMAPQRRAAVGNVALEMPAELPLDYGSDPGFPLHVGADPRRRVVVLPVRTIKWLDEYAGLWAWLHFHHPDQALVMCLLYAAMMVTTPLTKRVEGPLEAFGLDGSIYNNAQVKDVSNKHLNGALSFLLLHELGHLALSHGVARTNMASQEQERAADAYALDAMAELHILAIGVPFLFFATTAMECAPTTHPLSGERVAAIALRLETEPHRYVDRQDPNPERVATQLREYGRQFKAVAVPMLVDPNQRVRLIGTASGASFGMLRDRLST